MKKLIVIFLILIGLLISVILFRFISTTSFGEMLAEDISETDEITHINLYSRVEDEPLWLQIDDPEMINTLIEEQSIISIRNQYKRIQKTLDYSMTIHTRFNSYYFDFDDEFFSGRRSDYKIINGSFIEPILQLDDDLEWLTGDELFNTD
ncbi:hypothetical protein AJ85_19035 [Alkalihalobacillus alcalophilus ATCC 27647 = CGMCC 1.3604]|uniref:Uncharacterized protein n=1 Tax=Alkalihalobacillus alcalophilus ATCC 27647 = CGMCC 1.3604 TaxID=1218173 RepID=A0A094WMJ3_ALKAL|nr:hypothetical protein [Alkalihalobacillus alcalophilus]KGA98979.1 hypothetical protein BALCAV_0201665 [Alkalihalobacillus alcalophilus ATCC 27647 = CGMCC 1.3604]THG89206.1 hypothetical protein AJ85_19035 [Alkalihalobacillus alcalophilus ATCC 27647 = CGMCC 1.3604]